MGHCDVLLLNPHFHTPALDGVYVVRDGRVDRFLPLPPPSDAEVEHLVKTIRDRVLRLLDRTKSLYRLEDLGMPPEAGALYTNIVNASFGMVIVGGPTGSGKTTTLYATLS